MLQTCRYFKRQDSASAPPAWLTAFEVSRFALEMTALLASRGMLHKKANGDGHAVLVLPGLLASDATTTQLRRFTHACGHDTYGWGLGINTGPTRRRDIEALLEQRIADIYEQAGEKKISLVGWSLGGVYARLIAHKYPDWIRQVITLGSPVNGSPQHTNAWRIYEWISGRKIEDQDNIERLEMVQQPLPVPCTSIYSKTDSIVAWQISRAQAGHQQQNIHAHVSHVGMAFSPLVFHLIQDRLAQPANEWQPYETAGLGKLLFNADAA
ncbi:MAG: esterase/lipase family protein [Pseudomonadales bacterium]